MKTFWLILSLNLFASCLLGQQNNIFQLELGIGMNSKSFFTSEIAQGLNVNSALRYHYKSFEFGLRYEQVQSTIGIEAPSKIRRSSPGPWYIREKTSDFANFKSIQLLIGYSPNFKNFKPIFGVGIARNRFDIDEHYYDRNLVPTNSPFSINKELSKKYYTVIYQIGYKIKDFRYTLFVHSNSNDDFGVVLGTSIGYNLALSKKQSLPKHYLYFRKNRKERPVLWRLEVGRSIIVPMVRNHAASARFFINAQFSINKHSNIGFSYEAKGNNMGKDENTVRIVNFPSINQIYVRSTVLSESINAYKGYFQRTENYSPNIDYFYGGGLGIYKIDTVGEEIFYSEYYKAEIKKSTNFGAFFFTGFRTGVYSNKIEFNVPFGKIPLYIGLQTAIGIQGRKKAVL